LGSFTTLDVIWLSFNPKIISAYFGISICHFIVRTHVSSTCVILWLCTHMGQCDEFFEETCASRRVRSASERHETQRQFIFPSSTHTSTSLSRSTLVLLHIHIQIVTATMIFNIYQFTLLQNILLLPSNRRELHSTDTTFLVFA